MAVIGLVEDEAVLRRCLARTLERRGHSVKAVETAEEGYAFVSEDRPDLLITDLRLPGMSGQDLLEKVKQEYPDTPVIMITAHGTSEDAAVARAHGVASYLRKPLDLAELGKEVERCLPVTSQRSRATDG